MAGFQFSSVQIEIEIEIEADNLQRRERLESVESVAGDRTDLIVAQIAANQQHKQS